MKSYHGFIESAPFSFRSELFEWISVANLANDLLIISSWTTNRRSQEVIPPLAPTAAGEIVFLVQTRRITIKRCPAPPYHCPRPTIVARSVIHRASVRKSDQHQIAIAAGFVLIINVFDPRWCTDCCAVTAAQGEGKREGQFGGRWNG